MFDNTEVILLSAKFGVIKRFFADVQSLRMSTKGTVSLDYGLTVHMSRRMFCDYPEEISCDHYLLIGGKLYKPLNIIDWDDYAEAQLYKCGRDNVIQRIDELFDFFIYEFGVPALLNGVGTAVILLDSFDRLNEYDYKHVMARQNFGSGALIETADERRLVISDVPKKENSYIGKTLPCNHRICFNYAGDWQWFDVFMESRAFDIDTGNVISLPQGVVMVWIQENEQSLRADIEQRFINTGRAWKVTGIDRTRPGLMRLTCEITVTNEYDNMELEIADYYKYIHDYAISVSNTAPVEVGLNSTTQLIFIVTDNGVQVATLPEIVCMSSDEAVAAVTNKGLITGIANGEVNITADIVGQQTASCTVPIKVTGSVAPSYSVVITFAGQCIIKVGGSAKTFTAVVYENGTEVTDKSVVWSVVNKKGGTPVMATLSAQTALTCKLQAPSNDSYIGEFVVLTAKLSDDQSVTVSLDVEIDSLF